MRLLPLLILLSACAGAHPRASSEADALTRELSTRVPGPAQDCLPPGRTPAPDIVDASTIVYRERDTLWVSRLDGPCPGLSRHSTLVVEPLAGRICRGTRITAIDPGSSMSGPTCVLRTFVPYRKASR